MEKVMLSKEQVKAIESSLELSDGNKAHVIKWHAQELFDGVRAPLNEMDLDTVIRALYAGYELEPSPEEKILKWYEDSTSEYRRLKNLNVSPSWDIQEKEEHWGTIDYYKNELNTLKQVMEILNIKGINCS